jgi:MSHA biogenesis protein MshL
MFGLAVQTNNFAALISFLETQGTVHVLSSPRVAAVNNQKAVLKIGTDEFFVTGVTTTTNTTAAGNTVTPSVTLQPFFSGVVLDVTPQIDEKGNILLHVHPSVSQVSTINKGQPRHRRQPDPAAGGVGDLGTGQHRARPERPGGGDRRPDAPVRDQRHLAAAGRRQRAGAGRAVRRNKKRVNQKRELVVLIKPTIVEGQQLERRPARHQPPHRAARSAPAGSA